MSFLKLLHFGHFVTNWSQPSAEHTVCRHKAAFWPDDDVPFHQSNWALHSEAKHGQIRTVRGISYEPRVRISPDLQLCCSLGQRWTD